MQDSSTNSPQEDNRKGTGTTRILILGGGFGGVYAALHLERMMGKDADYEITLVSETNYILFTPMLHEVAASDLDLTNIVNPIRKMLKRTRFVEAIVEKIDLPGRTVTVGYAIPRRHIELGYDKLLISLGSLTHFTDGPGLREHAVTMKSLHDAVYLRNRMIALLEDAANETDAARRKQALTFVIAGGGFAGVETIGAMNDFLTEAMKFYPDMEKKDLRVILVHPGKVLLPEFKEKLGRYTADKLKEAGIDVRLETKVTGYDGKMVTVEPGEPIPAFSLIWAAGVTPPPEIEELSVKKERGRLVTNGCMEVEQFPGVWAVGDCASIPDPKTGKPFPATAQHAIRQGKWVAKNILATMNGGSQRPFTYTTLRSTRGHRPTQRHREHPRTQFFRLPRMVFVANAIPVQAPPIREKAPSCLGLVARLIFHEGHRSVHHLETGGTTLPPRRRRPHAASAAPSAELSSYRTLDYSPE